MQTERILSNANLSVIFYHYGPYEETVSFAVVRHTCRAFLCRVS